MQVSYSCWYYLNEFRHGGMKLRMPLNSSFSTTPRLLCPTIAEHYAWSDVA